MFVWDPKRGQRHRSREVAQAQIADNERDWGELPFEAKVSGNRLKPSYHIRPPPSTTYELTLLKNLER